MRLFSTEAVSKYHPDKYADQISDAILTECLRQDRHCHCGIETLVKDDAVVVSGEIKTDAGVSDRVMFQMLIDNPNIITVCLCLDNDEAGWAAEKRMSEKLSEQGIQTEILVPSHKDWNEVLLFLQESEEENECRELQL